MYRPAVNDDRAADLAAKVAAFTASGGKVTQAPAFKPVPRRPRTETFSTALVRRLRALAREGKTMRYAVMCINDEGLADKQLTRDMVKLIAQKNGIKFNGLPVGRKRR